MPPKKITKPIKQNTIRKPPTKNVNTKSSYQTKSTSKTPTKKKSNTKLGPSKETIAAIKIQKYVRMFLAKCQLSNLKQAKIDYDKQMEDLEKEALISMIKREQAKEEKRREKEDEERRRKLRAKKRIKKLLEAAFDDEVEDIKNIIQEGLTELPKDCSEAIKQREIRQLVECRDPHENSPLGEAAAGGAVNAMKYLLENGANPNHKGQWKRTPLYRSAFAGHVDCINILLNSGADPRIVASDTNTPRDIAGISEVQKLLDDWDISKTDPLIENFNKKNSTYKNLQKTELLNEMNSRQDVVQAKKEIVQSLKKQLNTAWQDYEKRIYEHDNAVAQGFDKPEITIQCINDAEMTMESLKIKLEKAQADYAMAQMKVREQQHKQKNFENADSDDEFDEFAGNPLIMKCTLNEIPDVLFRDVGNKIKESGKWPMIIDSSGKACLFLRYQDTNYVNILDTRACSEQKLKESLLGSIRYGKPLIIDLQNMDLWNAMESSFNRIKENLWEELFSKTLMENQNYMKLIDIKVDKPEYHPNKFAHMYSEKFKLVILTGQAVPPDEWVDVTYPVEIVTIEK